MISPLPLHILGLVTTAKNKVSSCTLWVELDLVDLLQVLQKAEQRGCSTLLLHSACSVASSQASSMVLLTPEFYPYPLLISEHKLAALSRG